MSNPREFKLEVHGYHTNALSWDENNQNALTTGEIIHVIEYSAYEEMRWEYENVCKFATQFEEQLEALRKELNAYKCAQPSTIFHKTSDEWEALQKERDELKAELEKWKPK